MARKNAHIMINRLKNGKGAIYDLLDFGIALNKVTITCPTCGKKCPPGTAPRSNYIHREQPFITRQRFHCSEECTPDTIQSK